MPEHGTIIQIGDILVSEEVVTEFFCCDYEKCRGCCCVAGDGGAPLQEAETEELERHFEVYSPLLTKEGREAAQKSGFFEIDRDGDIVTPVVRKPHKVEGLTSIPGSPDGIIGTQGLEDCAYCLFENGNVLCAVERCFFQGKYKFRKPASCWLYPIRVTRFPGGGQALNYHRWNICKDAVERGKRENIRVFQFLRETLCAIYGEEFYDALCYYSSRLLTSTP